MKSCLIFFYIVATFAVTLAADYCDVKCNVNGTEIKHIACNNNNEFSPDCKPNITMVNIDESLQKVILDRINAMRNFAAGGGNSTYKYSPACRMATIQWDNELAEHAALNVKQCNKEFDNCHGTKAFPNSGQYTDSAAFYPNETITSVLESLLEHKFKLVLNVSFADVLADRNIRLGCACSSRPAYFSKVLAPIHAITCNYATDIHDAASMYSICQSAGETCASGRNPEYPNLCTKDEKYDQ